MAELQQPTLENERQADLNDGRMRLLDAAERCFERWGATRTSLADIAAEAGLSRATLYRYFDGRGELVAELIMRSQQRGRKFDPNREPIKQLVESLLRGRDFVNQYSEGGRFPLAEGLRRNEALAELSRAVYRKKLDLLADNGKLRQGTDIEDVLDWILFVRQAVWADSQMDRSHLEKLLIRYFGSVVVADDPAIHSYNSGEERGEA